MNELTDFATGKPIRGTPEESVRQEYERVLHHDFGYPLNCIDIEFTIARGTARRERADIVVFDKPTPSGQSKDRDQSQDIVGIVECKRFDRSDGLQQLKSYMSATSCVWGVWTNGETQEVLYKDPGSGKIAGDVLFQVPRFGHPIDAIGSQTFAELRPATNLKLTFRRLLNEMYTNTNISRREKLGNEMTKLLFCKLQDEQFNVAQPKPRFRTSSTDHDDGFVLVRQRIDELFEEVRQTLEGEGVFEDHETITLDNRAVAYVVGELQTFSLTQTDEDIVGNAFEVFAESKFAGEKGEFFTPRDVVRTAIHAIAPCPGETIIDPACGSGGFLISALHHIWHEMKTDNRWSSLTPDKFADAKRDIARQTIYGLDKDSDLVRIAKAYMAIIGDGKSRIAQANSLHTVDKFEGTSRDLLLEEGNFKQFDIVLTNPPFGSKDTKVSAVDSAAFDLGHKWVKKGDRFERSDTSRSTPAQELFIERCLTLLRPGGRMAIILPETYGHAPSKAYIRQYLEDHAVINAVIDLPHNTFRPHCNAKTLMWIVTKSSVTNPSDHRIIFAAADEMGRDHHGKIKHRIIGGELSEEVWNDLPVIRKEWPHPNSETNRFVGEVKGSNIRDSIYVPRFYLNANERVLRSEADRRGYDLVEIETLIEEGALTFFRGHGAPPNQYKGTGEVPYVRVGDIGNWAVYRNPTAGVPKAIYSKMVKGRHLEPKDLIFVHDGSYRIGDVGIILPSDTEILLDSHCLVVRVSDNDRKISSLELAYLLRHDLIRRQLPSRVFFNTTLPDIGNRWRSLLLPIARDPDERSRTRNLMEIVYQRRIEAETVITRLLREGSDFASTCN